MGLRFRKSVKIAPGVRLNFGKKSTSVSLGGKGARFTVNSTGKKTASVGIPGTGLYYTESVGGGKKTRKDKSNMSALKKEAAPTKKAKKPIFKKWWFWTILVGIVFSVATGGGVDAPEEAPQQVQEETVKDQTEAESVVTEEPEAAPTPEPEEADPVPEPEVSEPEPPVEEPKVEEPVPEEPVAEPEPPSAEPIGEIVYVSKSGKKYHSIPDCSGMKKPLEMTKAEAEKTRKPCENCW